MQYLNVTNQLNESDWYDSNSELSKGDQKWIWDNIPLTDEELSKAKKEKQRTNNTQLQNDNELVSVDVTLNGSVNGTCKNKVNNELNWYKSEAVDKLKKCKANTPQKEIASYLEEIFKYWPSYDGYWKRVSIFFTSRVINWVLGITIKEFINGAILTTPVKYFSEELKHRFKRKRYRSTEEDNDTENAK